MVNGSSVSEATPPKRPPCTHDSMRIDGMLDNNCMRCGADGYWHRGHRYDQGHPSGKLLIALPATEDGS